MENTTIYYKKTFKHPVEKVFNAFTTPEQMLRWWHVNNFKNTLLEVDFNVGGNYKIEMELPNGNRFSIEGVYKTIVPNKKLEFTFNYVNFPKKNPGESLVSIDFVNINDTTEINFQQRFITRPEDIEGRTAVWEKMFNKLGSVL